MPGNNLCQCLEAQMPKVKPGVKVYYTDAIDRAPAPPDKVLEEKERGRRPDEDAVSADWFEDTIPRLRQIGLAQFEIDLLTQRFLHGMTFREIQAESQWTSHGSAEYHYKMTLKKLRERGFKL